MKSSTIPHAFIFICLKKEKYTSFCLIREKLMIMETDLRIVMCLTAKEINPEFVSHGWCKKQ